MIFPVSPTSMAANRCDTLSLATPRAVFRMTASSDSVMAPSSSASNICRCRCRKRSSEKEKLICFVPLLQFWSLYKNKWLFYCCIIWLCIIWSCFHFYININFLFLKRVNDWIQKCNKKFKRKKEKQEAADISIVWCHKGHWNFTETGWLQHSEAALFSCSLSTM